MLSDLQSLISRGVLEASRRREIGRSPLYVGVGIGLSCNNPPAGAVGAAYAHVLLVIGPPVGVNTFTITAGALPDGLTLGLHDGVISGTPTLSNTFSFTAEVNNTILGGPADANCTITIQAARADISVTMRDTGYAFRTDEADTSTSLGQFGVGANGTASSTSTLKGSGGAAAQFPTYNSLGGSQTAPYRNEDLHPSSFAGYAFDATGPAPADTQLAFDGAHWWVLDFGSINPGGIVLVKAVAWPGILNENATGLTAVNITNPDPHSVFAVFPVNFSDGSKGLLISASNVTSGVDELLPITLAQAQGSGAPATWITDQSDAAIGTVTLSWPPPGSGYNLQADLSQTPTLQIWRQTFDISGPSMVQTVALHFSGILPADPLNAFAPPSFPNYPFFYFHDAHNGTGIFGIDFDEFSGANTGCWYCSEAGSYGRIVFAMPDASSGPSSDPAIYWVYCANNGGFGPNRGGYKVFPNTDVNGDWWWIREPLVDTLTGTMIIESLTGEVYTTAPGPATDAGGFSGTFTGFLTAGKFGGGTK